MPARADEEVKQFDIDPANFEDSANIDNQWMPLKPGLQTTFEGQTIEDGEAIPHRLVINVTDLTKVVAGVRARVILETDYTDDLLVESELAFVAQDKDGNVWHLGEYRETYDETEFVGGRVWVAGLPAGAKAGISMWANPQPGSPAYSQGYAPPPFNWADRADVYKMGEAIEVPYGKFENVLVIRETSEEEPDAFQLKYYAAGVGNIGVGWTGDDPNKETLNLVELVQLDEDGLANIRARALELETRAYMYSKMPQAERQ